jgi:hypothetical protein
MANTPIFKRWRLRLRHAGHTERDDGSPLLARKVDACSTSSVEPHRAQPAPCSASPRRPPPTAEAREGARGARADIRPVRCRSPGPESDVVTKTLHGEERLERRLLHAVVGSNLIRSIRRHTRNNARRCRSRTAANASRFPAGAHPARVVPSDVRSAVPSASPPAAVPEEVSELPCSSRCCIRAPKLSRLGLRAHQ